MSQSQQRPVSDFEERKILATKARLRLNWTKERYIQFKEEQLVNDPCISYVALQCELEIIHRIANEVWEDEK